MEKTISSKLSERKGIDEKDKLVLFKELQESGINTVAEFNNLFTDYLSPIRKIEKKICKKMLKNYKKEGEFEASVKILKSCYVAPKEDVNRIKQGKHFAQAGMVRTMILLKYGEEKAHRIGGKYEMEEIE